MSEEGPQVIAVATPTRRLASVEVVPHHCAPCVVHLRRLVFADEEDATVIAGPNGVGKTTTLHAVYMAARDAGLSAVLLCQVRQTPAGPTILRPGEAALMRQWVRRRCGGELQGGDLTHLSDGLARWLLDLREIREAAARGVEVIVVDTPETYLNAEMQRQWVRTAVALAPGVQLIIATHSEEVFGSVPPHARVMLRGDSGGV